jgi:hypothetical protein
MNPEPFEVFNRFPVLEGSKDTAVTCTTDGEICRNTLDSESVQFDRAAAYGIIIKIITRLISIETWFFVIFDPPA